MAIGLKPTRCKIAPESTLTGTDTMPVMLFANIIVVTSVPTK